MKPESIILLIIIPLIGAVCCLVEKFTRRVRLAPLASIVTLLLCLGLLGWLYPLVVQQQQMRYTIGGWPAAIGINHVFDGLSWMGCSLIFVVSCAVLLFALAEKRYEFTFYFFFLIMIAAMVGVLLAADLFNMFVFFEILGLSSYILIAYLQKRQALLACFKYLMLSSLGMTFFLLGIYILYQHTGTLSLSESSERLVQSAQTSSRSIFAMSALIAGISVRTAYIPFHVWLPEAHASAPHPVSAMLSGLVIKISFLSIWRLLDVFEMPAFRHLFVWVGAGTALIAVFWALCQTDCKKLLAWHSISQMGYIITAFGAGHALASVASLYHLINHALFKSLLFLCIGSVIIITGERNIKQLGSLGRHEPFLMVLFFVGAGSIMGLPPFNGFISKKLIQTSVKSFPLIASMLWLAGVGTMASFIKLSIIFRQNPYQAADVTPQPPAAACSRLSYLPLGFLASLCVLTGATPRFFREQIAVLLFGHELQGAFQLYSGINMLNTLIALLLGAVVYYAIFSHAGHRFSTMIRQWRMSFQASLIWCILGFMLLAIYAGW
ncbi:MAG: proton-conducting transporter membrane subunit [Candidatus Vecturithrix sp.]|jgi:multicomponent Na+:H+ antiporter subunit D|nr:proton-conducting transporter membrane subunit [Candidatus Vecturithrix sp.]